jgi:hypothetical protein
MCGRVCGASGSVGAMSEPIPCAYPGCDAPNAGTRGIIVRPEPIEVALCETHLAIVDSNRHTPETRDFWRWFDAVSGYSG